MNLNPKEKYSIAEGLRRYGIEGESAFYAFIYPYFELFSKCLSSLDDSLAKKAHSHFKNIDPHSNLCATIHDLCSSDPTAAALPDWYQYFIGRKYRVGSGKFFTPHTVAHFMASLLPPSKGAIVMDPTCGGGTFLKEYMQLRPEDASVIIANDVELTLVELTTIVLSLSSPSGYSLYFLNESIYDPSPIYKRWYGKIDYILANPPFSLRIDEGMFESKLFTAGFRNSDALFLDMSYLLLRPGGRLVCLLPHSIIANNDYAELRSIIEKQWNIRAVLSLPEGVFHLSGGTTTRADIVVLDKSDQLAKSNEVIFASIPNVGIAFNKRKTLNISSDFERLVNDKVVRKVLQL